MVSWNDVFPGGSNSVARKEAHARRGGPSRRPPTSERSTPSLQPGDYFPLTVRGSHMPLDINLHWRWNNPLNVIPLLIVVAVALALVALIA